MNPHTRYEIHIAPLPRLFVIMIIALMVGAILGSIYLAANTQGEVIPSLHVHIEKPHLPDVQAKIQEQVDSAVSKVVSK